MNSSSFYNQQKLIKIFIRFKIIKLGPLFRLFLISLFFFNCHPEKTIKRNNPNIKGSGIFIVNEGTFGIGNASLHYINLQNDSLNTHEDLFKPNNNRPLGDVFQSMFMVNNNAWLIVNNSGKIEVVDPQNSKSIATISNLKSPRYGLSVTAEKIYVSDLYANVIHIINANTMSKTGEIKCKGWTEEMILYQNKVWVTNHNSEYLYVINAESDVITDSIKLAYGGSAIVADKEGKIWVMCSGDLAKNKVGGLFGLNANTQKMEKQWLFSSSSFNPIRLKQNAANDSLYFINNGVFGFAKTSSNLPVVPIISQPSGSSFYGLTIQKSSGNILVADAMDYVSKGMIKIYSPKGNFIKSYKVGVVPSDFLWW